MDYRGRGGMFMFETIKRIYGNTGNKEAVTRAQSKGWITPEEANQILGTTTDPEGTPD